VIELQLLAFIAALLAGAFGAIVGVGGGLIIVPLLSVGLGVPLHNAIAASLLGVIAVSTTASAPYLRSGLADRRLGLALLGATALGGMFGGYLAGLLDARLEAFPETPVTLLQEIHKEVLKYLPNTQLRG